MRRKLFWFAALWLAGVGAITLVAYTIRAFVA
jgi:hypothetical protein